MPKENLTTLERIIGRAVELVDLSSRELRSLIPTADRNSKGKPRVMIAQILRDEFGDGCNHWLAVATINRAAQLSDWTMRDLRFHAYGAGEEHGAQSFADRSFAGWSKGRIINKILRDEYCEHIAIGE